MAKEKAGGVKFTATIEKQPFKGGMHYMDVPTQVAHQFTDKRSVRVFCQLNSDFEFACAIRSNGKGGFMISVGLPVLRKAKVKKGDKVQAAVRKDHTKYGHKEPEELKELLAMDDEGRKYWEQLTNGAQRSLIYYINSAKSVDKRIERCLLFINRLKDTQGAWKPGKN
ncbi:MAG: YdeI/OmpD-associated family protein [Bacteroidota bacterium]